jgi:hypothetical protein
MRRTTMLVVCTLALALFAGYAAASTTPPPPDTLKVDYFSGANTGGNPLAQLRIVNPGTFASGGICAAIYVFDSFQEMSECCSCPLSPDSLRTLDVNVDLTSNPLTGVILTTGAIKIVSTPETSPNSGVCAFPVRLTPTAGVRAWVTHIQDHVYVTETASQDATFSYGEQVRLQGECYGIQLDGSKKGVCTCGVGD